MPPTNRWADRIHELRVRVVLEVLCETQAEGLARVVGIGRICSK